MQVQLSIHDRIMDWEVVTAGIAIRILDMLQHSQVRFFYQEHASLASCTYIRMIRVGFFKCHERESMPRD
jgi:hypothetical protein